jgi:hypothetical protein
MFSCKKKNSKNRISTSCSHAFASVLQIKCFLLLNSNIAVKMLEGLCSYQLVYGFPNIMFAQIEVGEIYKYNIIQERFKMHDPHQGPSGQEA